MMIVEAIGLMDFGTGSRALKTLTMIVMMMRKIPRVTMI
jgi:hypothetical protein